MSQKRVAIYARVSSKRQAEAGTIESQLAALRERVEQDGFHLSEELTFVDEGYSGATLIRPGLERLRDVVALKGLDRLYVLSPDRLARKYAYQVLLLDEFQQAGVEVIFLNWQSLGETPEEELFIQVQGIVAEYRRAKIRENSRRGKRHSAQAGNVSVLSGAPYGYHYVNKEDGGGKARYEIVPEKAQVVRQIFRWVGLERVSIGEVCHQYAYYGKAISNKAAKGKKRDYAYYRCIGTDAYRFAGERVCDNIQVRTDMLDQLVWEEICALLEDPQRLEQEYQHRLQAPNKENEDLVAIQAQIVKVRRGIARLIDSYAEGFIEKQEFQPRISRLRQRLTSLETQTQQLEDEMARQAELRLVVTRLEDFAAKVTDSLAEANWLTKRELIRTLVRQVEIGKEEVNVVFRVTPDPFDSSPHGGSLQRCWRGHFTAIGEHILPSRAG